MGSGPECDGHLGPPKPPQARESPGLFSSVEVQNSAILYAAILGAVRPTFSKTQFRGDSHPVEAAEALVMTPGAAFRPIVQKSRRLSARNVKIFEFVLVFSANVYKIEQPPCQPGLKDVVPFGRHGHT